MANTTGQSTAGNMANNKALQTGAQVAVAASPLAPLAPFIPMIMSMAGNFMSNRAEEQSRQAQADDSNNALSGVNDKMDAFRTAWQNVQKGYQDSGEKQFMNEANTALPELQQARTDIANQGTEAQQQLSGQLQANMARQGVRGGQASTIQGRAMGQQGTDMQRQINQMAVNEATNRQAQRLDYTSQKGLMPYKTLTQSENMYMPSTTEQAYRYKTPQDIINKQYGA